MRSLFVFPSGLCHSGRASHSAVAQELDGIAAGNRGFGAQSASLSNPRRWCCGDSSPRESSRSINSSKVLPFRRSWRICSGSFAAIRMRTQGTPANSGEGEEEDAGCCRHTEPFASERVFFVEGVSLCMVDGHYHYFLVIFYASRCCVMTTSPRRAEVFASYGSLLAL